MHAITWQPGTDTLLDPLFDFHREMHFRKQDHPLWKNYNRSHFFEECVAISLAFNEHNIPVLGSSILKRDCWPNNVYRILNRLWAMNPHPSPIKDLHPSGGPILRSQIDWLKKNYEYDLVFISRESSYWQEWTVNQYKRLYDLEFEYDTKLYQVCDNPVDDSCWQRIIYQGNKERLTQWSQK